MTNNILQELDRLYDECSKMDKASRIGYLLGCRQQLYSMANQMATYIACKGGPDDTCGKSTGTKSS